MAPDASGSEAKAATPCGETELRWSLDVTSLRLQPGVRIDFQLIGNLTMHGKTNKEVFDVQGRVVGNTITGMATSTIYMTDFGIQPPNLANIAIAQNKVAITLTFTVSKA